MPTLSLSAINGSELKIEFNQAVDKKTATNVKNYVFLINDKKYYGNPADPAIVGGTDAGIGNILNSTTADKINLSKDGKTVTFLLNDSGGLFALKHGDKYGIDVKDGVLAADGKTKIAPHGDIMKVFEDQNGPQIVGKPEVKGKELVIKFNEHVDLSGTADGAFEMTIDGMKVTNTDITASEDVLDYSITVDLSDDKYKELLKNGKHDVAIFNIKDYVANNAKEGNESRFLKTSYEISGLVEPSVVALHNEEINQGEVDIDDFNSFTIEFDRNIETASVKVTKGTTSFFEYIVQKNGASVKYFEVNEDGTKGEEVTEGNDIKAELSGKFLTVHLPTAVEKTSTITPLYEKNAQSVTLNVEVKDFQADNDSLLGKGYKGTITLKRDSANPTASSVTKHNVVSTGTGDVDEGTEAGLYIKLNRTDVELIDSGDFDLSKLSVVDGNGYNRVVNDAQVVKMGSSAPSWAKENDIFLYIELTNVPTEGYATQEAYEVSVAADAFKVETDITDVEAPALGIPSSIAKNTKTADLFNKAFKTTVKSQNDDTTYKAVEGVDTVAKADVKANDNIIKITYKQKMDASATKLSNYTIQGEAFPAGTKIEIDGEYKVVEITLPKETIVKDIEQKIFISKNVKTAKGETIVGNLNKKDEYHSELITFNDNTAPVLTGAKFIVADEDTETTDTIELTFSEAVTAVATDINFEVIAHDGTKFTVSEAEVVSSAAKTVKIKLVPRDDQGINVNQAATVTVVKKSASQTTEIKDANTNTLKVGTTVSVKGTKVGTGL